MAGINYISPSYMYKKNNLNVLQPQRSLEKGSDLHTYIHSIHISKDLLTFKTSF